MELTVIVLAALVLGYGAVSGLVSRIWLTGPIIFTAAGLLLGDGGVGLLEIDVEGEAVAILTEVTLVLLLFADAARIDLPRLRVQAGLPARMLASLIGVIALGTLAGMTLLGLDAAPAALLAALLAPTDAALGQAMVTDPRLPVRVRQTLNVESGLNDGIVLPVVTILIAVAGEGIDGDVARFTASFVARQVGGGIAVGVVAGLACALAVDRASARGWVTAQFQQIIVLAGAVGIFAAAEAVGGNGFVAAFVGGMAFGSIARHRCGAIYDFAEEEGTLLTLIVFAIFGAAVAPSFLGTPDLAVVVYVVLSLSAVRMVPIAVSLVGTHLRADTVALFGWFGPRGLASILFLLLVVEELGEGDEVQAIAQVVACTVLASVLVHGASAVPLAGLYSRRVRSRAEAMGADAEAMPEMRPMPEFRTR